MKNKIFKAGFGYLVLTIMVIGISIILVNNVDNQLQETTNDTQEEIPLQEAVGESKVETKQVAKAKTTKKKKTTKKTTKKVKAKKYVKSSTKKANLSVSGSKAEIQQYAHQLVLSYGWSEYDWQCLIKIINHESGWNPNAVNKSSGACGLPQALPCSKMASAGADYRTNYKTQLKWMMGYIKGRYKTPSRAWSFWQKHHWY